MKQLETLHLYNLIDNLDWSGIYLLELPFEVIQEIYLYKIIQHSDHTMLSMMLKKCKKLLTFGVDMKSYVEDQKDEILKALSSQADTLKNLGLQFDHNNRQSVLLSKMSTLIHLQKLDVSSCRFVSDAFLEVVSRHCKNLTYLNLFNCDKITDAAISSICNLKRLTYLNIRRLPKIRNPPLEKLTSLVVLDSFWNEDIQEECLCSFLRNAPQLRTLNVSGCRSVTNELLNAAAEAAKIRNSNDKLDLYVNDTWINPKIVSRIPSFVNILKWDLLSVSKYGVENPFRHIYEPEVKIT